MPGSNTESAHPEASAPSTQPEAHAPPVRLSAHDLRRIAVKAHKDPRTVATVLQGRGTCTTAAAVHEAIAELGIKLP